MSDRQRPAGHQGVPSGGLKKKNTRANELGKGIGGWDVSYHTQDKTEAFLPEKREAGVTCPRNAARGAGSKGAVLPC